MRLHAPSRNLFLISLVLAVAAVLSLFVMIPVLSGNAFWVLLIGYVVLLLGVAAR